MARRQFSREFKLEAIRLVKERGVSVVQASRDLDVGENVLRRWIKELTSDPGQAFPGQGLRWSRFTGQVVKLGSPMKDGPDDGQAEAIFG